MVVDRTRGTARSLCRLPAALALLLAAAPALMPGCTVGDLLVEGRPCSADSPCGPGTVCDQVSGTCVSGATKDSAAVDRAVSSEAGPDAPRADSRPGSEGGAADSAADAADATAPDLTDLKVLPDKKLPDSQLVPDAGCPKGKVQCGSICVDTTSDVKHCGGCNKACPVNTTDSCINSKCLCGTSSECFGGLNCKAAKCQCILGGLCKGCCSGNTCLALGSTQSVTSCGYGGQTCKSCVTKNACTNDVCTASGTCSGVSKTNGTSCDDGVKCTYSDACQSGVCKGTSYSCDDLLTCTVDSCTNQAPPLGCSYSVASGYCAIGVGAARKCYSSGSLNPSNSCEQCDTTKSQVLWSTITNCGGATVSSVVAQWTFNYPRDVWVYGTTIFVADMYNHAIRTISSAGTVGLVAGTINTSGYVDGTGSSALFNQPSAIAMDSSGYIYVADRKNNVIRRITSAGVVSTFAGTGSVGSSDGPTTQASFYEPCGVAVDSSGAVYVADTYNYRIRKIYGGQVTTIAGSSAGFADGAGSVAKFYIPMGLMVDGTKLWVADTYNNRIRTVDLAGTQYTVTTVAGSGTKGYLDGSATSAQFSLPSDMHPMPSGRVYISEYDGYRIRMLYNGSVSTVAGDGTNGYQDGAALQAKFRYPYGLYVTASGGKGQIYVADYNNHTVRLVTLTGLP